MKKTLIGLMLCGSLIGASASVFAQFDAKSESSQVVKVPSGAKKKVTGTIVKRDADNVIMRDLTGGDIQVMLTGNTKGEEK
jgi:hypothetical protein